MKTYFFKIFSDSDYVKQIESYIDERNFLRESALKTVEKFGIKSRSYIPSRSRFIFVPTSEDKSRFKDQLLKDGQTTRKTSEINKYWQSLMANDTEKRPHFYPMFKLQFKQVPYEVMTNTRTVMDQFWDIDNHLYLAVNIPDKFKEEEVSKQNWLQEISGAEFYTLKEEYE